MTRRTIIYKDSETGKLYASPEFNGDKTEFEMFQLSGECDADWNDILKEFKGVNTLREFMDASERAQKHYKPFVIYNETANTPTELGGEILPVYEIDNISKIKSDHVIMIKNKINQKLYRVKITENLVMTVEVEAENESDAEQQVDDNWHKGEYILDDTNFMDVTFEVIDNELE